MMRAGFFVALQREQVARGGVLQQAVEGAKAVIAFVEARATALQMSASPSIPDLLILAALGEERLNRGEDEIEGFLLAVLLFLFLLLLAALGAEALRQARLRRKSLLA